MKKIKFSIKNLFLIDGFGALISAFLLGVVLTRLENVFGMPRQALYVLAFFPCVFAVYDFLCFFLIHKNGHLFLKGIAIANLSYCAISIGFLIHHHLKLSALGWTYFLLELVVVIFLAQLELKISNRTT